MTRLSRDSIVETATALLADVGLEGLTTRRLALELGVKQPALYWHFKNHRELLDAIGDAMISSTARGASARRVDAPERCLATEARTLRRLLLAHRDGAAIHASGPPSPGMFALIEDWIDMLIERRVPRKVAIRMTLAAVRFTVGWTHAEQAVAHGDVPALGPSEQIALSILFGPDVDSDFDFALDALIDGMARSKASG